MSKLPLPRANNSVSSLSELEEATRLEAMEFSSPPRESSDDRAENKEDRMNNLQESVMEWFKAKGI